MTTDAQDEDQEIVMRRRRSRRTPLSPDVVGVQEAAERLGVHRSTAYDLIAKGRFPLPVIRVGASLKVSRAELEHLIRTGRRREVEDPNAHA